MQLGSAKRDVVARIPPKSQRWHRLELLFAISMTYLHNVQSPCLGAQTMDLHSSRHTNIRYKVVLSLKNFPFIFHSTRAVTEHATS